MHKVILRTRQFAAWVGLACLLAAEPAAAFANNPPDVEFTEEFRGRPLDRNGLVKTFGDNFKRPSVTTKAGRGPWYSPIHGGYGAAKFLPPRPGKGPILYKGGNLVIRMEQEDGRWYSSLIQTVNGTGHGFTQKYGYFEMRAKFPKGKGSWPAFWLKTVNEFKDRTETRGEIDVIEAYGGNDYDGHHQSIHLWPANRPKPGERTKHWGKSNYTGLKGVDMFDGKFHTYGAEVSPEYIIFYFDDKEVSRVPTLPEYKAPLFVLVSLAMFKGEVEKAVGPMDMVVDWVRVWQRPEWVESP